MLLTLEAGNGLPSLRVKRGDSALVHNWAMELQVSQGGASVVRVRALEREEHDFVSVLISKLVALGAGREQDGTIPRSFGQVVKLRGGRAGKRFSFNSSREGASRHFSLVPFVRAAHCGFV